MPVMGLLVLGLSGCGGPDGPLEVEGPGFNLDRDADDPAFVQDWGYSNREAFLAAPELRHVCNPRRGSCNAVSGVRTALLTGLTGTPWGGSQAARSYFSHIDTARARGESASRTMIEWTFPEAASRNLRHIWIETWIRFSTSPQWSHPGGSGQKTIFVNARNYPRIMEMRWGNSVLQARGSNNGSPAGLSAGPVDNKTLSFDGRWHRIRAERRIGAGDGILRFQVDDLVVADSTNAAFRDDTRPDYFRHLSLGETSGNDCHLCYIDWGEVRIYDADPGWSW